MAGFSSAVQPGGSAEQHGDGLVGLPVGGSGVGEWVGRWCDAVFAGLGVGFDLVVVFVDVVVAVVADGDEVGVVGVAAVLPMVDVVGEAAVGVGPAWRFTVFASSS
ncbi:MAG: hypothetical protein OXF04_04580 [bacterium]|nr:hypothetical protein [bacterium]MCY4273315.1 hypothetical protein [bacterium]